MNINNVICKECGEELEVIQSDGTLIVVPCGNCLEKEREMGYSDGYDEGYSEGERNNE